MARIFAGLKLRLLLGAMGRDNSHFLGMVFGLFATALLAVMATPAWLGLRGRPEAAVDVAVVTFTVLVLLWAFLPLFWFGSDETVDPARFALLPLTRRQLMAGLLAASLVGLAPLATLVALAGSVPALATDPVTAVVACLAVAVELTLCVVTSRMLATVLSRVLRSRRGRDVALFAGLLVGVGIQLPNLLMPHLAEAASTGVVHQAAGILRWSPPGLAAHAAGAAGQGSLGVAAAELGGAVLAVGLLVWWWSAALGSAMVTVDSSTGAATRPGRLGLARVLARLLPAGRVGAVAMRELRYARRDPRRRSAWVSSVVVGVLVPAVSFARAGAGPGLAYLVCLTALVLGTQCGGNQLGMDGQATWLHMVTGATARDVRADFAGRNLAAAIVAVPTLLLITAGLVLFTESPADGLTAFAGSCAVFGLAVGIGNLTSVLAPYRVPENPTNIFAGAANGQGCLAGLVALGGFVTVGVLALPVLLPAAFGLTVAEPAGAAVAVGACGYGLLAAWLGRRAAAGRLARRLPEMLSLLRAVD